MNARGTTERETCELNGWTVGTVLRGHERWGNGDGVWGTIRITAIGESTILARCLRHERTAPDGSITSETPCSHREHMWTLRHRDWEPVTASERETPMTDDETLDREMGYTPYRLSCRDPSPDLRVCRRARGHDGDHASGFGTRRIRWAPTTTEETP